MADESEQVGQDEIEQLLRQAQLGSGPKKVPTGNPGGATLGQDEIEALISQSGTKPGGVDFPNFGAAAGDANASRGPLQSPPTAPAKYPDPARRPPSDGAVAQGDLDFLLNQAEQALASINAPTLPSGAAGVTPFRLVEFGGAPASSDSATLDLIRDVELDLKIELGRTNMYLEDVLKLCKGAVVSLDKLAGDPVDIFVNGRLIARGEVLILNDNFCVRVAELVAGDNAASA